MSDNVKDELYEAMPHSEHPDDAEAALAFLAERGFLVLGPDGEPIDVRPALRALGDEAWPFKWTTRNGRFHAENRPGALRRLAATNVTGPLADICLAAAEVEP